MGDSFSFTAPVWEWAARDNWFFVRLPDDVSEQIRELPLPPAGFGSVKVAASAGMTRWSTSIFPESHDGAYVLPLKKAVRVARGIEPGDLVTVEIEIVG
ncbi:DUF1905 domain-containing protein [Galbitalea soli]|uniref:DUF1905 domain-containing protein n=1 Tax=Galbitalea soli TaxID=1268042 RepID=A0A7C9PNK2_9MICO|nr:DUF1905 domain-containing protein [Galbitalea soli]NYJ30301.1 hypothetical protein [Galbitalea soli]